MSSNKKRRELNRAIEEHEIAKLASSSNNAFNAAVWKAGAEKLQADNDQLRSELAALKAENESLRRDAEWQPIVKLAKMKESNGRVTWSVHLAKSESDMPWDWHQIYSDSIKGRAEYEADSLRHFFGQAPKPDILKYDSGDAMSQGEKR